MKTNNKGVYIKVLKNNNRLLSGYYSFHIVSSAVRRGLEPLTPCVTGTYSNQLN